MVLIAGIICKSHKAIVQASLAQLTKRLLDTTRNQFIIVLLKVGSVHFFCLMLPPPE
jgi:hypothetical protein